MEGIPSDYIEKFEESFEGSRVDCCLSSSNLTLTTYSLHSSSECVVIKYVIIDSYHIQS